MQGGSIGLANSWFQFWFNTEHDGGNFVAPAITPSMSTYGRGVWLWDTGFHVMALLAGGAGRPRSLLKAKQQLQVRVAGRDSQATNAVKLGRSCVQPTVKLRRGACTCACAGRECLAVKAWCVSSSARR